MVYNPKHTAACELQDMLEVVCDAAQRFGITRFHGDLFEVNFTEMRPQLVIGDMSPNRHIGEAEGMPTDDQLLFASSIPMTDEEIAARPPA